VTVPFEFKVFFSVETSTTQWVKNNKVLTFFFPIGYRVVFVLEKINEEIKKSKNLMTNFLLLIQK